MTDGVPAYLRDLSDAGIGGHILGHATAQSVLTDERRRLLSAIAAGDVESKRDLARRVDRDISIVSRDLDVLYEADLIEYRDGDGRKTVPVLAHYHVWVKPLVYNGDVVDE